MWGRLVIPGSRKSAHMQQDDQALRTPESINRHSADICPVNLSCVNVDNLDLIFLQGQRREAWVTYFACL